MSGDKLRFQLYHDDVPNVIGTQITYGLVKTEMFYSTDLISAEQELVSRSIMTDFVDVNDATTGFFWFLMQPCLRTLEYDSRRQILYRNGDTTTPVFYVAMMFSGG